MACTKETVNPSGLNIWSSEAATGPAPVVDIIAVQGLGAHPYYTWVKKTQSSNPNKRKRLGGRPELWQSLISRDDRADSAECMWLRDLLVPLFKDARVATYSYKSDWRDREVKTSLRQCAEQLLNILTQHRQQADEQKRPLVLIGHSLGGLVIQEALVVAILDKNFTNLRLSVAGVVFLGAPFQGSDIASVGTWFAQVAGLDPTILKLLQKDSPSLYPLSRDFWGNHSDWDLVCFYEVVKAEYGPIKKQIVSPQSASLVGKRMMALNTDHSGLNKFSGKDDENFKLVLPEIRRMVKDGPSIVVERHRVKDNSATSCGNVHWIVPRPVNDLFTGRSELLLRIQKAIRYDQTSSPDKQKRFVITGMGGQGKSEICLKVASQMREDFWGVFWVDVGKASNTEIDFIAIAKLLGRSVKSVPDALNVLASTKQSWLLILDNADDLSFDYQVYFPSGTQGAVLMTSRVQECKKYSPEQFKTLEGLEDDSSKELLFKAADIPQELWLSHTAQAEKVVKLLGSHTLALIQAGAYIAKGHCQLYQYPEVYLRQRERLMRYRPEQARSRYRDVYTTFEASTEVLEQSGSEAARDALDLLAILSMLDSAILPLQIFQSAWDSWREVLHTRREEITEIDAISQSHVSRLPNFLVVEADEWDPFRLIEASSKLASLSLVIRHGLEGLQGLSMHPLTHAWAKDRQDLEWQGVSWVATGCVLALSRSDSLLWRTQERRLLPHTQSYLDIKLRRVLSFRPEALVVPILLQCGYALLNMRQDSRLSHLLEDMFTELGKNPGKPLEEFLPLYDLQARSLLNMGRNKEAVALLEQVVKIKETTLAKDHPDRLLSQYMLAIAYEANKQAKEAIALLKQVVKIEEITLAKDHPSRLASQHVLALAYRANGQVKEAIALLEQVVKIEEITLAKDHPSRLASQHVLALAYQANGQVEEAVALLKQVVKIKETTLAKNHPDRLVSQHALALAYQANGQVEEAVALLKQVVKIKETALAKDHPDQLMSQHALALAYQENGQVEEAAMLLEQVVKTVD